MDGVINMFVLFVKDCCDDIIIFALPTISLSRHHIIVGECTCKEVQKVGFCWKALHFRHPVRISAMRGAVWYSFSNIGIDETRIMW